MELSTDKSLLCILKAGSYKNIRPDSYRGMRENKILSDIVYNLSFSAKFITNVKFFYSLKCIHDFVLGVISFLIYRSFLIKFPVKRVFHDGINIKSALTRWRIFENVFKLITIHIVSKRLQFHVKTYNWKGNQMTWWIQRRIFR